MNATKKNFLFIGIALILTVTGCSRQNPSESVDPFIGTGGHGHTYPGPSLPFGMIQAGPDTRLTGWDGCSGYHYSDAVLYGFSHTHLSGTGIADYCDLLLMPTTGPVQLDHGSILDPTLGYCSRFSHEREQASPGYYSVFLEDYGIEAELTVSLRSAFHRYRFPAGTALNVVLDLLHRDRVLDSRIRFVSDLEIEGMRRSSSWAKDQWIFFVIQFSRPMTDHGISLDHSVEQGLSDASGKQLKAYAQFAGSQSDELLVKVGISAVDTMGARRNLMQELPHWEFDRARESARAAWDNQLGKISINGGTVEQQRTFYTALYHASLNPNLFQDVDGRYFGRDFAIHQDKDFQYYTLFSLWDTFRAAHPLLTILEPERTGDFIRTFLAQYQQGGRLPVWELAANETDTMIGYHAVSVIVDAYVKGVRDFDIPLALRAMRHSAEEDLFGLRHYKELGYIPLTEESESVSKTLEYAYDDWCIAEMARLAGEPDHYQTYIRRAQSYKNIFDPQTGFMRGRTNGGWFTPFDPSEVNFNYTEANAWQYLFFVPHDVSGLMELMGGEEEFVSKLDGLFSAPSATSGREQADITGLIGQYAHGNEPSHHMAYLYNFAGQPWKTQNMVRRIMDELYTDHPDGLCGNEDCGQMSAWYVFSALGFYPVTPGTDLYIIGAPLFPEATIKLDEGKLFTVRAENVSSMARYVQQVLLNGEEHPYSYLRHADIMAGGELRFIMGKEPNRQWAADPEHRPVSIVTEHAIQPVPYVARGERTFTDATEVSLAVTGGATIHYTLDGTVPSPVSPTYDKPIQITRSTTLKAMAVGENQVMSRTITARFSRIAAGRSISITRSYAPQYSGGGDHALIDTLRGAPNFRTGTWQGYEGVDLEAVVDLGRVESVRYFALGCLQDTNSWIFMPEHVEFFVSADGKNFKPVGKVMNNVSLQADTAELKDFILRTRPHRARYVKVRAKSIETCPRWHKGAGGKAWLFADEIVIN